MTTNRKFSVSWAIGIFLVHAVFTLILGLLIFASEMGSFTNGPGFVFYAAEALMWVWSPFAMLANDQNHRLGISSEAAALLWSLVVGLLAGFIAARFRKPAIQDDSAPPANPDLAGTPWAKDSHFTLDPAHQSKIQKNAESNRRE